jgi:hypothetical protein
VRFPPGVAILPFNAAYPNAPSNLLTLLMIGHDPAMRGLTLELAGEQSGDAGRARPLGRVRVKYPIAAIAVLSFSGDWTELSLDAPSPAIWPHPNCRVDGSGLRFHRDVDRPAQLPRPNVDVSGDTGFN